MSQGGMHADIRRAIEMVSNKKRYDDGTVVSTPHKKATLQPDNTTFLLQTACLVVDLAGFGIERCQDRRGEWYVTSLT